jgi:hypothetical protein
MSSLARTLSDFMKFRGPEAPSDTYKKQGGRVFFARGNVHALRYNRLGG